MKTAVIVLGLLVAFVDSGLENSMRIVNNPSFKKCQESEKPMESTLDIVRESRYYRYGPAQCFQACVLTEAGVMTDSEVDTDKLFRVLKLEGNLDMNTILLRVSSVKECKEEAETMHNRCMVVGNYLKCLKKLQLKMKMPRG